MSWLGSFAKTQLARLDVCRSAFLMRITCSGEQIQPVEKGVVQHVLKSGPIALCIHLKINTT